MEDLIDRIYEAAVLPELWPSVLDRLNELGRGYATFLFAAVSGRLLQWVGSKNGGYAQDYFAEDWPSRTDRVSRLIAANHAGFVADFDVYTREEMDREPVFTEFLRPRGLGWGAATAIEVPNGDMLVFDVERLYETGHVEQETLARLDHFRPHLARAALVSARVAFERVQAVVGALEAFGLPAAVLNAWGRTVTMNGAFESLIPHTMRDSRERLKIANGPADILFSEAIAASYSKVIPSVSSIAVPASEEQSPLIIHLLPVRRAANDVFAGAHMLVVCTIMEPGRPPAAELLKGLFDLTAAEARVARAIACRKSVDDIAEQSGVSRETVRSQLKSVMAKTGTQRQIDLASLLCGGHTLPRRAL